MRSILALALSALLGVLACGPGEPASGPGAGAEAGAEGATAAPDFTLETLHGDTLSLADLRGKVVVIDFWATWCPPCEFQIPILNEVHAKLGEGDVAILGISVDTEGPDKVREYLEKHPADYPVLMGSEALARKFGAPGFPSLILVDPEGRLGQVHVGLMEAPDLEAAIAEAAQATPPTRQAEGGPAS